MTNNRICKSCFDEYVECRTLFEAEQTCSRYSAVTVGGALEFENDARVGELTSSDGRLAGAISRLVC
jgi:hypothetical protein